MTKGRSGASAGFLLLVCIAALLTAGRARAESVECKSGSLRLPRHVKPVHYELDINVQRERPDEFTGRVNINIEHDAAAQEKNVICRFNSSRPPACDTKIIVLHASKQLEIQTIEFVETKTGRRERPKFCRDNSNSQLIVHLDHAFDTAGYLSLAFVGQLIKEGRSEGVKGFIRTNELDAKGRQTPIWFTSFEPVFARAAFPCFDEPDMKATFGVTIRHPKGLTALSNMHEIGREVSNDGKFVSTKFANSPKMSTYLVAFAVGELEHIEMKTSDGKVTFRAWTPPGRAEEARQSLGIAVEGFENFARQFYEEQPLKKVDFLSVSWSDGGMENWGLVTARPSVLLRGRERYNASFHLPNVHYSKNAILHEVAHFWFGNLVTMKWWDDLWLNEGFAMLMANAATNLMLPEFGGRQFDLINEKLLVLGGQSSEDYRRPIKELRLETDSIEQSFNMGFYKKSSCVLDMLTSYIGGDAFLEGLRNYIQKFKYGNAEDNDLWESLAQASGRDVSVMMESWLSKEGFPLIEVCLDKLDNSLRLRQRKFPIQAKGRLEETDSLWQIPVPIIVSNEQNQLTVQILLNTSEAKVLLPDWFRGGEPGHWVKVNANFAGLFRVSYEDQLLEALREPIERKLLGPVDRMNVLDDCAALMNEELINTPSPSSRLREVVSWYRGEDHELVLHSLLSVLDQRNLPEGSATLKDYFHNKLEPLDLHRDYLLQGQETLIQTMVRARVIHTLVRFNYLPAVEYALKYYRLKGGEVAPYLRVAIYSAVASSGTWREFEQVLDFIARVPDESERDYYVFLVSWVIANNRERMLALKMRWQGEN